MRYIFLLLLLAACSVHETGDVHVDLCPDCAHAYSGFDTCAFFDVDENWSRPGMLVDSDNYAGVGTPIRQQGYMHHKFCFNDSHVALGSANPTQRGLQLNRNYVIRVESALLARAFSSEYNYLRSRVTTNYRTSWTLNNHSVRVAFCPRDSCEKLLLKHIDSAQQSVTVYTFSFTSKPVADALLRAQRRGVNVFILAEPWGASRGQLPFLKKQGISVIYDDKPGLMHAKAFIVDEKISVVGSYNPTKSGNTRNAEALVVFHDPSIARQLIH